MASADNRPPYTLGSNNLLREIARTRPADRAALLQLKGMGERMFEKIGQPFLDVVDAFSEAPPAVPPTADQPSL
jgi:ATP-dependent DNA helicase RecQ